MWGVGGHGLAPNAVHGTTGQYHSPGLSGGKQNWLKIAADRTHVGLLGLVCLVLGGLLQEHSPYVRGGEVLVVDGGTTV